MNQKWQKPAQGFIKIIFDGSVKKAEKKKRGPGIIARNEKGEVMGVVQATIDGVTEPKVIKAYAACRGMKFAQQTGFTNIILEGDSLPVILKILQLDPSLSFIGNLTEKVKSMKKNFRKCKIQHVKREANGVAHSLAKSAFNLSEDVYWVEECPDHLILVIISDCNLVSI